MNCSYYYCEDGNIFISKIEALAYSKKNNKKLFYHYYDDVWSKYDWTIEPSKSLEYYYKEQAQLIRDTYDYVILCYSGGYDSTNILETFYYNNIKLDKIVIVGAFSQDSHSGVDENHNGELYHNAFPYIEQLSLSSITEIFDYTTSFDDIKKLSVYSLGDSWFHTIQGFYSPHNWFWYDLEKYVIPSEYKDKKVAIVFGKDKPYLEYDDDKNPQFSFSDNACMSYAMDFNKKTNITRINFYWDPCYPFILIKQLHNVHDAKKIINDNHVEENSINNIIYNLKKPLLYKSPKSTNRILSLRDSFLGGKNKEDKLIRFYIDSFKKMNTYTDITNLPIIYSKPYKL
jgi:hypothetical protein